MTSYKYDIGTAVRFASEAPLDAFAPTAKEKRCEGHVVVVTKCLKLRIDSIDDRMYLVRAADGTQLVAYEYELLPLDKLEDET